MRTTAALYHTAVELENLLRTENREQRTENRHRIQLQRPLLSPVDRRDERANMPLHWLGVNKPKYQVHMWQ